MTDFPQLTQAFSWSLYSKKLIAKIDNPKSAGFFTQEEADARDVRLVEGIEGTIENGNCVHFYWLVDKDDGILIDVRFQAYGNSALIGAAQAATELMLGKNYDQAKRITSDLLDKELQDKDGQAAFPKETYPHLNLILGAIDHACSFCTDLPLPDLYVSTPSPRDLGDVVEGGIPGWIEMPLKKKLAIIEDVLDREIRPYIALDAGGVEVINLLHDKEVVIVYQGSCTSCYSSVGTTLTFIQQMLRAKVHPEIIVTPDIDMSKF